MEENYTVRPMDLGFVDIFGPGGSILNSICPRIALEDLECQVTRKPSANGLHLQIPRRLSPPHFLYGSSTYPALTYNPKKQGLIKGNQWLISP